MAETLGIGFLGTGDVSIVHAEAVARCLTQSMAKEMAPHRIYVNAVCPGILRTAM